MHNNYYFLKQLAKELDTLISGNELLAGFSQEKDELVLGFSNSFYLKCILKPEFSAITVIEDFSRARKNSVSLWEELYGLKVEKIAVFENERALQIVLEDSVVLVIKLFGNRPNLLVFKNAEFKSMFNNRLLSDKSLKLEDFNKNVDYSFSNFEALDGNYKKMFFTFGKDIFEEVEKRTEGLFLSEKWENIQQFLTHLEKPQIYIDQTGFLPKLSLIQGEKQLSAVAAINTFVGLYQRVSATDALKSSLTQKIEKDIAKTKSYIKTTSDKLKALKEGVKNDELGNILMANLHLLEEGQTEAELFNFYSGENIIIKLKKDLSPQKNAEVYYRKSKNEKIEIETTERNIDAAELKLLKLEEKLENIDKAEELKLLRGLSKGLITEEKAAQKNELPFKEYLFRNVKIWVGRNAKNNDLLLTKYAQKDDVWLHARDTSGSHVVIKSSNPSPEVLEYAASLAAYYSKRRSESLVTVIYTPKKYVRKAKNLAAGQVIVEREKTLLVEPRDNS